MEAQSRGPKLPQSFHNAARRGVAHDGLADLTIRRMHGNVERAHAAAHDARKLLIRNVRERHIIAHDERKPPVVILEMQRFAAAARQLVNKAEQAMVAARAHGCHQRGFKGKAQGLVNIFFNQVFARLAAFIFHGDAKARGRAQMFVIDDIHDRFAVDGSQIIALRNAASVSRRKDIHRGDSVFRVRAFCFHRNDYIKFASGCTFPRVPICADRACAGNNA